MSSHHERRMVVQMVMAELDRAERLWPDWPTDLHKAQAICAEENGEVTQVLNDIFIHGEDTQANRSKLRTEAVQRAAMALRFLINLERGEG